MEGTSSIFERRVHYNAGFARMEALARIIAAGWRAVSGRLAAAAENQRRAQARRELHRMNDHFLKDIGLDRRQIDRLFR